MGSPATVPMFAPDGTLGDVPAERVRDAAAHGFKVGVTMKSTDGQIGVIPQDRVRDAMQQGKMQIVMQHGGNDASLGDIAANAGKALGSDLWNMAKSAPAAVASMVPGVGEYKLAKDIPAIQQHYQQQKQAGYSLPYRALTPVAENLGVNVSGMEQSAAEGDIGGVAGHAAAVPTAMAATAGIAKAAPVISDIAASETAAKLGNTVKAVTKTAAKVGDVASFERFSKGYSALEQGFRNVADIWRKPEATLDNITDQLAQTIADDRARHAEMQAKGLGEIPATGAQPAAQTGEALATQPTAGGPEPPKGGKSGAPRFTADDRANAKALLQDALQQGTKTIVDKAVPPTSQAANGATASRVEFYLKQGDVAGAEKVLDNAARVTKSAWTPPERQPAPTINEIKARAQSSLDSSPAEANPNGPVSWKGHTWEHKGGQFFKDGQALDKSDDIADALAALSQKDYFGGKTIEGQIVQPKTPTPSWQPLDRQIVPSTNDIRARIKAEAKATGRADQMDTQALQQEMRYDLERHGWSAEQEARREFIARNSTGFVKTQSREYGGPSLLSDQLPGEATPKSGKGAKAPAPASDDLTDILQKSLDEARKRRQQK